jgi:hypothetical protein
VNEIGIGRISGEGDHLGHCHLPFLRRCFEFVHHLRELDLLINLCILRTHHLIVEEELEAHGAVRELDICEVCVVSFAAYFGDRTDLDVNHVELLSSASGVVSVMLELITWSGGHAKWTCVSLTCEGLSRQDQGTELGFA